MSHALQAPAPPASAPSTVSQYAHAAPTRRHSRPLLPIGVIMGGFKLTYVFTATGAVSERARRPDRYRSRHLRDRITDWPSTQGAGRGVRLRVSGYAFTLESANVAPAPALRLRRLGDPSIWRQGRLPDRRAFPTRDLDTARSIYPISQSPPTRPTTRPHIRSICCLPSLFLPPKITYAVSPFRPHLFGRFRP